MRIAPFNSVLKATGKVRERERGRVWIAVGTAMGRVASMLSLFFLLRLQQTFFVRFRVATASSVARQNGAELYIPRAQSCWSDSRYSCWRVLQPVRCVFTYRRRSVPVAGSDRIFVYGSDSDRREGNTSSGISGRGLRAHGTTVRAGARDVVKAIANFTILRQYSPLLGSQPPPFFCISSQRAPGTHCLPRHLRILRQSGEAIRSGQPRSPTSPVHNSI